MHNKWTTCLSIAALLAHCAAASADDASNRQLECWTPLSLDQGMVMTLPIGEEDFELVSMTLNGMEYAAAYVSDGLQHRWHISPDEGEVRSDYQVILKADLTAGYFDFSGVEEGEEVEAQTFFVCRFIAETHNKISYTETLDEISDLETAADSDAMRRYVFALQSKIQRNFIRPASAVSGIECVINVRQLPSGEVVSVTIGACNGNDAVRRAIEAAVHKSSPLPHPENQTLFATDLRITFKPEE